LDYKAEIKILKKLTYVPKEHYVDPLFYETAAFFSVLARILTAEGFISKDQKTEDNLIEIVKMLSSDEKYANDTRAIQLRKQAIKEDVGFNSSISPRKMSELLSGLIIKFGREGVSCLDVLNEIENTYASKNEEYKLAFKVTSKMIDEKLKEYLMDAFLNLETDNEIEAFFKDFLINLTMVVENKQIIDPVTNSVKPVDMKKIEVVMKAIGSDTSNEKIKELYYKIASIITVCNMEGRTFKLKDDLPYLYKAIRQVLYETKLSLIGGNLKLDVPIPETKGILRNIVDNLLRLGFTERSTKLLIDRVYYLLQNKETK
jgi:hypothetical protein